MSCTLSRAFRRTPIANRSTSIAHVTAIEAVDPLTVRLRTKSPDAALLFRLGQRFITNKAAYDRLGAAAADKLALGTGPYKLKDWVRGQWFVVEKNPGYAHSDHKPTVDEIVFRNIPGIGGGDHLAVEQGSRRHLQRPARERRRE